MIKIKRVILVIVSFMFMLHATCVVSQNNNLLFDYGFGKQTISNKELAEYNIKTDDALFNFYTIAKKSLEFKLVNLETLDLYGKHETIVDSIIIREGCADSNIRYTLIINKAFGLFLYTYKYQYNPQKDKIKYKKDIPYFYVSNNSYSIDSLFYGEYYNESKHLINTFHKAKFKELYYLDYNNRTYYLCYPYYFSGNSSIMNYKPILFYFNHNNPTKVQFVENNIFFQNTSNSICFNDFDNDGILDYLFFDYENNDVPNGILYSIIGNEYIKRNDYYLYIYDCEYGKLPKINKEKSSWVW